MKLTGTIIAGCVVLSVLSAPGAHAQDYPTDIWDCPHIGKDGATIELHKMAVHVYELKVTGNIQVNPLRIEIREKDGKVLFNGKPCQESKSKKIRTRKI